MSDFAKYRKYKSKYLSLKNNKMVGGKKESENSDAPADKGEFKFVMHVSKAHVKQDGKELKYEAQVTKVPPIRLHFRTETIKLAMIVKRLLRFINKRLRMTDVTEVHLKMGKDTKKYKGDKLDEDIDVSKEPKVDEIKVLMTHTPAPKKE
jgi:hypothetical protein